MADEPDLSEQIRAALARVDAGEDPELALAGVPVNWRKWLADDGGIVLVENGHELTDGDVSEARSPIAAGEDSMSVWGRYRRGPDRRCVRRARR